MIYAIFFLSGVSALIFQHIWFRQTGLVFGNSVWASSLVLSSFMAGLAIGNGLATALPQERARPLRWYSILEAIVAITGVGLVFVLPALGDSLIPLLGGSVDSAFALGVIRFVVAFALLVVPTAAMGMTLPVLVGRAPSRDLFGVTLGRLYGWNTLGAVFGAIAGEAFLYERIGIVNTAFVAGSLNLAAAALSLWLDRMEEGGAKRAEETTRGPLRGAQIRLLLVAALAGGALLALEVVWTRFLLLSVFGTALTFAIMLALALVGMALGSLFASRATRLCSSPLAIPTLAMLAAIAVTGSYTSFADALSLDFAALPGAPWTRVAILAGALILPASMVSGALFNAVGTALSKSQSSSRAAGLLTLANTVGAMAGALLAGFGLLPVLGMERSFRFIAAIYVLTAVLSPGFLGLLRRSRPLLLVSGTGLFFTLFFPTGLMERTYIRAALRPFAAAGGDTRVTAFREGLTETIAYVDALFQGETVHSRLITNGFSMSGTMFSGRRYMEAFVYLPVAIHPHVRRALLISYGVGSTARALTETREIEKIDVVDISREVLEMAGHAVPPGEPEPLKDPRVSTHIEDGRFFLQTATEGYDLITSEPPPPHLGGVVNLYTLEYFALLKQRLNPGGIVSYWLPVHSLSDDDSRAISSAFCAVFSDCTLWKGMNLDWILLGTNDLKGPVSAERFSRQWTEGGPRDLRDLGIEVPEQMGALFMAEGRNLPDLFSAPPLQDNYPGRLSRSPPARLVYGPWEKALMDSAAARERFMASAFIRRAWPAELRESTLPYFAHQRYYDEMMREIVPEGGPPPGVREAVSLLRETPLAVLPGILLGTSGDMRILANRMEALGRADRDWMHAFLGVRDLTARRYESAADHLRRGLALAPASPGLRERLILALCLGGRKAEAEQERRRAPLELDPAWTEALDDACAPSSGPRP